VGRRVEFWKLRQRTNNATARLGKQSLALTVAVAITEQC